MPDYRNYPDRVALPDGTAITTGNTGYDNNRNFNLVSGACTLEQEVAILGRKGYRFPEALGVVSGFQLAGMTSGVQATYRWLQNMPATNSATVQFMNPLNVNGSYFIYLNASGRIGLTLPSGTWNDPANTNLLGRKNLRFEVFVAASASVGQARILVYNSPFNTSPLIDSGLLTGLNTGSSGVTACRFGKGSASGNMAEYSIGAIDVRTGATAALFGPYAPFAGWGSLVRHSEFV